MKTLGNLLLSHKEASGTRVRVEPIQIQSVQTTAPYIALDEIAFGDADISLHSAQSLDLQDYVEPAKPTLDGMKFSQRKFSLLLVVKLPSFAGSSRFLQGLTDDQSQAPRSESLVLFPVADAVQLPANAQAIGLLSADVYQLSVSDLATKRSKQLGFIVSGTEQPNWATIAHEFKRRAKRDADELRRVEAEVAPAPTPSVEAEVIDPEFTLVAGPDAKYVVRQLKRLNPSILQTVQVVDGYLVEDLDGKLPEAQKYVASFRENLSARNVDVATGMEREFFPELFQ
jgi:hypothetical protein